MIPVWSIACLHPKGPAPFWLLHFVAVVFLFHAITQVRGEEPWVDFAPRTGDFCLANQGHCVPIVVATNDYWGVLRAAHDLQSDLQQVTGIQPGLLNETSNADRQEIVIGTLGHASLVDSLVKSGRLDASPISGKWETYLMQVVDKPWPGVDRALVVAGSDKRGTIYGIYALSEQCGVSPWHFWADVPAWRHPQIFVRGARRITGPPAVKYRGLFLNDEAPDLTGWVTMKYGQVPVGTHPPIPPGVANYGSGFYTRLFELMLRLRANYLWPAMWNNAFAEDDTNNASLADAYGIVMGTSHQEPMMRAQKEWDRRYLATLGPWNYGREPDLLEDFWREGMSRNRGREILVTLGLRGANDTPMAPGGPQANRTMLEHIVARQRKIISQELGLSTSGVPQLWCLYKEVQDYYDSGMRVPDDVTLLWAGDNWGNLRRLPTPSERARTGGAGVYYHLDYHGSPRNYQWINTSSPSKIWDQMSLAAAYGADRVWMLNVGHLKGYERPIEFFMRLAWNPGQWRGSQLRSFTRDWCARAFGPTNAQEMAHILISLDRFNGARKPEMLSPDTYSLTHYQEAERVMAEEDAVASRAQELGLQIPSDRKDAYQELVLFPARATALLQKFYLAAGRNELYARQGRADAWLEAEQARNCFGSFTNLMAWFNTGFEHGRWNHFMDQPCIGYKQWNEPASNNMNAITLLHPVVPALAAPGLAVEGSENAWPRCTAQAILPDFDVYNRQVHYFEIFNQGGIPFQYRLAVNRPWIHCSTSQGRIGPDQRVKVSLDWNHVPIGISQGAITLTAGKETFSVAVRAFHPLFPAPQSVRGFVEGEGVVAIEPEHFTRKVDGGQGTWECVQDYGRTMSGMRTWQPVDWLGKSPEKPSPCLEYRMFLFHSGLARLETVVSPTLNFIPGQPLRLGVSLDDQPVKILQLVPADYKAQAGNLDWEKVVADNARSVQSRIVVGQPGYHTLKYWMVDPGVVLQRIILDMGGLQPSYLGPPESFHGALN